MSSNIILTRISSKQVLSRQFRQFPVLCQNFRKYGENQGRKKTINSLVDKSIRKTEFHEDYTGKGKFGFILAPLGGFLVYLLYEHFESRKVLLASTRPVDPGEFIPGLPVYSMAEVSKHCTVEDNIWVVYKQGVYDITKFVAEHPGGDNILLATGSSIEPFWMLYSIHKTPEVFKVLEGMRIGNLSEEEAKGFIGDMSDPYRNDPVRHNVLRPASRKPFNAEPPADLLVDSFLTPNELFFVRNHLPVPQIKASEYELEIVSENSSKSFSLDLQAIKNYPKYSVTSVIMCTGNRRTEMAQIKNVIGLSWKNAAVGNARWSGARLCDVLKDAGYSEPGANKHIQFEGLDLDPTSAPYGASIPIWRAFDPKCEVILAYEMNGQPLSRDHGYPVRVVIPGVTGARSVKWLGRIVLSAEESRSHWQRNDYKGFSPSVNWDNADYSKSVAIQELPVFSSICRPSSGEHVTVKDGMMTVQGYAWSGGGQKIVRVDVTIDEGQTWHVAELDCQDAAEPPFHWAWTLWTAKIPVPEGQKSAEIWAKAVDSSYNTQPERFENIWNFRGVLCNAYHRVRVTFKI